MRVLATSLFLATLHGASAFHQFHNVFRTPPSRIDSLLKVAAVEDTSAHVEEYSEDSENVVAITSDEPPSEGDASNNVQYAALEPGTVVHIQVGDIGLARKAWKKRRRTGSPLLVPCSVLNVDRSSTIRWNLIYLLEKFGVSKNTSNGISISFAALNQRYRSHLKYSLNKHAQALGFEASAELIENLFNPRAQETYGVKLVEHDDGTKWLQAPLSRFKAQKRANKAAVLQFAGDNVADDTIQHTGVVRNKNENRQDGENFYKLQPLSAALRVSQKEDVESGNIQDGSLHAAIVFDYDPAGDAGAPLLTLSLNPKRNDGWDKLKVTDRKHQIIQSPDYELKDLHLGDGPYTGKVVRLIGGGALVDCNIGRKIKTGISQDMAQVLGFLKFRDAVLTTESFDDDDFDEEKSMVDDEAGEEEDWDNILTVDDLTMDVEDNEEEDNDDGDVQLAAALGGADLSDLVDDDDTETEDITHLFQIGEDGSLMYADEDSGELRVLSSPHDGDNDDMIVSTQEDSDENDYDDEDSDGPVVFDRKPKRKWVSKEKRRKLRVGDEVEVFVKSVSMQSTRLQFTMDASIQGQKAVEIKHSNDVAKKLKRLRKQLGGMQKIKELEGQEMYGVVKATSNTGDWLYVEPISRKKLPVGIATLPPNYSKELRKGDNVVIRLQGIDESRGQLSMAIVER